MLGVLLSFTGRIRPFGKLLPLGVSVVLALVVLSPWLHAYQLYGKELLVSKHLVFLKYYEDSMDDPLVRVFPVPLDVRCLTSDPMNVSTPYLDAQMNVPLCLLVAVVLGAVLYRAGWRQRSWVAVVVAVPALLGAAVLVASVCPSLNG